jgi:beta-N-acetylhexosaminidase
MPKQMPIGPVMIDIDGQTLSGYDRDKISHPNTGAIILFSRNFADPEQIRELIGEIRSCRQGNILIAVDQEGGRVQRFQNGFTRLPAAIFYAEHPQLTEQAGWLMAMELLAVGVDFSFAPVLDVDCGISEIIGDRSFSQDCQLAAKYAGSFRQGMRRAGMAATGKHFPGHGAVALDSHLALPIDQRDLDTIRKQDLVPFRQLIAQGLEAVMPAHVVYPAVDDLPAGFSHTWIQNILRKELGFTGTVFSDDLSMEGAASVGDFRDRAQLAQQAGCDMILVCNNPEAAEQVLESIPIKTDSIRQARLKHMQGRPLMNRQQLLQNSDWQQVTAQISELSHDYA